MPADIDLRIHAAGTAEHLAPRLEQRAVVHVTLWFGIELPVVAAAEHQLQEAQRHVYERIAAALRTGFEQQYRIVTALGQAVGHRTPRRARADHHIIEVFGLHSARTTH